MWMSLSVRLFLVCFEFCPNQLSQQGQIIGQRKRKSETSSLHDT
jgi:hypothetical protein